MLEWVHQPTLVHENNWKTLFTKAIGGGVPPALLRNSVVTVICRLGLTKRGVPLQKRAP